MMVIPLKKEKEIPVVFWYFKKTADFLFFKVGHRPKFSVPLLLHHQEHPGI